MCWGAVQWSRMGRVHIGVDRHTAAKYGFDDKVFYDEVSAKAGCYGLRRYGYIADTSELQLKLTPDRVHKNMVEVYDGILTDEVKTLFTDPLVNRTLRRRFGSKDGEQLVEAYKDIFTRDPNAEKAPLLPSQPPLEEHERLMRRAVAVAMRGAKGGRSKEREPFGVVIARGGEVIAEAHNTVLQDRDATATAEVNAIRATAEKLGTHNLDGCELYSTSHPDLMSLGAILWARISRVYCGVDQQLAVRLRGRFAPFQGSP